MRHLLPMLFALVGLGLSACGGGAVSPASIQPLESPVPVSLSSAQQQIVARDVRPAIQNALTGGQDLDAATAEFNDMQAVQAQGKTWVCGTAKVVDVQLNSLRQIAYTGELVRDVLFVRDYIGGNATQNAFVADICGKRGMKLGG